MDQQPVAVVAAADEQAAHSTAAAALRLVAAAELRIRSLPVKESVLVSAEANRREANARGWHAGQRVIATEFSL